MARRMTIRRPARAFARLWLVLLVAGLLAPLPARGEPKETVELTGSLPVMTPPDADPNFSPNGSLIVNARARRAYQLFQLSGVRFGIQAFDLDTLKPYRYGTITGVLFTGNTNAGISGQFLSSIDEDANRIYFPVLSGGIWAGVRVVDGETLKQVAFFDRNSAVPSPIPDDPTTQSICTSQNCLPTPAGLPAGTAVRGFSFSPAQNTPAAKPILLFLLQELVPPGAERNTAVVWAAQWDAKTGKQDWIYRVTACGNNQLPITTYTRYSIPIFQSTKGAGVYLACNASGGTGQVVQLLQDGSSRPTGELAYPGPTDVADGLEDPRSDRVLMRVVNVEGESFWVFDGTTSAYVGVIGATVFPTSTGATVDRDSGRLYVLAPPTQQGRNRNGGGLMLSDIRRSPVSQATQFEQWGHIGLIRIAVDPEDAGRPRRAFVLPTGRDIKAYQVFTDRLPISVDPPLADQDRFTTDQVESPGVTGSNFTGTGHGYGVRALFIGGLEGVPPTGPDVNGNRPGRYTPNALGSQCTPADREIVIGSVRQATLSNNLSAATATAAEADPGSKTDVKEPIGRCFPYPRPYLGGSYVNPPEEAQKAARGRGLPYPNELGRYPKVPTQGDDVAGRSWPYQTVECANEGAKDSAPAPLFPGYTSTVRCNQDQGTASAAARTTNVELGAIRVGDVQTSVRLVKDKVRGLVVRTESYVRGLEVVDPANPSRYLFRIDLVKTVGEAWAAGRTGTAGTNQLQRTLCGIDAPGVTDPDTGKPFSRQACVLPDSGALAGVSGQIAPTFRNQPPVQFILNSALGSRGRVLIPEPDPELKRGTPGGYLASVQKDRLQQISSQSVNSDSSTQVPALEITMFNDDPNLGRARQIYQLAGVDASSTYGIYLLNPALALDGSIPDVPLPEVLSELVYGAFPDTPYTPAVSLPTTPKALGNAIANAISRFGYGLKFLFNRPREAALASIVWLMLGAPVYLALRRRALLLGIRAPGHP